MVTAAAFESSAESDRRADTPPNHTRLDHANRWLADHGDALWRFAVTRVPHATAEDLVQETLLAAIKSASTFDGRSARETWLIGILSHKIADHYRSRARRLRAMREIDPAKSAEGPALDATGHSRAIDSDHESDVHSDYAMPDDAPAEFTSRGMWAIIPGDWAAMSDDDLLARLKRCTEQLPPILRDAMELRDLRGVPSDGVCQALGITPTNLWTRLHRARTALRRCMDIASSAVSTSTGPAPARRAGDAEYPQESAQTHAGGSMSRGRRGVGTS